ncbi:MAG: HAD family hydrolase [Pseudomonadota bacterium]|uniref:Cof-type HAD-IIB family hydrolase n=1 Tax=Phenylobacterium sp. TaxID=1871053 RepID=UPI0027215129|nr:HAD family hydrolase [Phenylobacterium sp.]MDO9433104.1 HAD family hydrolase [Phenylobacterium sp.]
MDDLLAAVARNLALVATDLDGTFLRSDGTISARTRAAVHSARDAGIALAFITARPPRIVRDLAREVGLEGMAVCSNGAILFDLAAGEMTHHAPLGGQLARELVAAVRSADPQAVFAVEFGHMLGYEPEFPQLFEEAMSLHPTYVDHVDQLCDREVTKLIVHHPHREPDDLVDLIMPLLIAGGDVTHSGGPFVEIAARGVSKATGLQVLCDQLEITAAQVVAFGDMPNDLAMLRLAGLGVAVGNAHSALLRSADIIAPTNNEDGVAVVLERILTFR